MTDIELRGLVLQAFYDRREDKGLPIPNSQWIGGVASDVTISRICRQLGEHGYLEWHPNLGDSGRGRITAAGCDVIEDHRQPDIAIQMVHNNTTNISSSTNVIVGNNNRQEVNAAFEELQRAVDSYAGSDAEKEESKDYWQSLPNRRYLPKWLGS